MGKSEAIPLAAIAATGPVRVIHLIIALRLPVPQADHPWSVIRLANRETELLQLKTERLQGTLTND